MIIMFDMDGVLASFHAGFDKIVASLGKDRTKVLFGHTPQEVDRECWAAILASETFWFDLPALVSDKTFKRISRLSLEADLYFVTNRAGLRAQNQTELWLKERGIANPTVIISPHKGDAARVISANFAIEDNADNALDIALTSEAKSYLLDTVSNKNAGTPLPLRVRRISSVDAFLDAVEV